MFSVFSTYFPVLLGCVILLYITGFLILNTLNIQLEKPYTAHFTRLMVGLNIFVITVAMFFTKGITVMVFLIPLLFYFIYKYGKRTNSEKSVEIQDSRKNSITSFLFILFAGSFFFFLFRFGQLYNPSSDIPLVPHGDLVFYANCIDFLTRFGQENSSCDYASPNGVNPYHYYELWQSAGFSSLLGLNTCITLILITFSIGNIIIWMGITAMLEQFKKIQTADLILCFLLVFTTAFVFRIYTKVWFMADIYVYSLNAVTILKFYPGYVFLIAAILFFINKRSDDAIVCLLALPIVHIGNALSIYPAVIIWYLIETVITKKHKFKHIFLCSLCAAAVFSFYAFLPPANSHVSTDSAGVFQHFSEAIYWKTAFNILAGSTIQFGLIFLPFILFYLYNFGINHVFIRENVLVVLIYIISLLAWALLYYKLTSTQLFANISLNMLNVIAVLTIILVWVKKEKTAFRMAFLVILLLVSFNNSFINYRFKYYMSDRFLKEIKKESRHLSETGAFMMAKEDYNFSFSFVSTLAILGKYLVYADHKTFPLSLSSFDYPYSEDNYIRQIEKETIAASSFHQYVEGQKSKGLFESIEKSQSQFIEEFKINYLICTKNVTLSEQLQRKIKKQIVDENTGERFYLLK